MPFIKCLEILVSKGANAHQQVQKLERFRDLEEERKILCLANKLEYIPKIKVGEEENVQKREEILKDRQKALIKKNKAANSMKDGTVKPKLKENEFHETMGLTNAYHFACACPHP